MRNVNGGATIGGIRRWQVLASTLAELGAGLALLFLLVEGLLLWLAAPSGLRLSAGAVYLGMASLVLWAWPSACRWLGWANRVTLLRGMLVAILAGAVSFPEYMARHALSMSALALLVLVLDGLDGWVARLTRSVTDFGARFDMELDAFFILVLCAALTVLDKVGPWVLIIGIMRYAFVLAGWRWRWLTCRLPESRRRKSVCVWQVASLLVGLLPMVSSGVTTALAAVALVLLALSFALDVRWLAARERRRLRFSQ